MKIQLAERRILTTPEMEAMRADVAAQRIPVRNAQTDEILLVPFQNVQNLDPVEQSRVLEELPTLTKQLAVVQGIDPDLIDVPELAPIAPQKWAGSFSIEPSPKPWFARPDFLIPAGIAVAGILFVIFRRK